MSIPKSVHIPVMLNEVKNIFLKFNCSKIIDATFGGGGHSNTILDEIPGSRVSALDRDEAAIQRSCWTKLRFKERFHIQHASFSNITKVCTKVPYDGVLFDLGISSDQIADASRGFSFYADGPLDMRMDQNPTSVTAFDIINWLSEEELSMIFMEYGNELRSRDIARAICQYRKTALINTTRELANLIVKAVPEFSSRSGKVYKHPATRVFQALRIKVNEELEELERGLSAAYKVLSPGGVIAVISFHALEDRIVKNTFKKLGSPSSPRYPTEEEVERNVRARSGRLRFLVK